MFGIGIWEMIILGVIGLIGLGTVGGIIVAVMIASASSRRQ